MALLLATIGCRRSAPEYALVETPDETVRIALARVTDGQAHFFTYKQGKTHVNFFVRLDGQGDVRTHFDACYSCYKYRLGYVQQDREVVCRACRIGYDLAIPIWNYVGPCVPITLRSHTNGSELVISTASLAKGARFF